MEEALQAGKGERTETRLGYRAGYYNRMLVTRVGEVELRVPQDRQGRFRTEVFERYQRSEKALVAAMLEMYVQGVSTRKVKTITEELCGYEFRFGDQSDRRATRRRAGEICQVTTGGAVSVPCLRCWLRKGPGRRSRAKPSRTGGHRDQLGR